MSDACRCAINLSGWGTLVCMEPKVLRATELRYRTDGGDEVVTSLADVDVCAVAAGSPVRDFSWRPRQGNYPGWLWTATTGSHVGYESLLERDRVLLADFDNSVRGIASKPFWVSGQDGADHRRHAPDYLLALRDGSIVVVDVKPAAMCQDPQVAARPGLDRSAVPGPRVAI